MQFSGTSLSFSTSFISYALHSGISYFRQAIMVQPIMTPPLAMQVLHPSYQEVQFSGTTGTLERGAL